MKVTVSEECIGCGLCESTAADVFSSPEFQQVFGASLPHSALERDSSAGVPFRPQG